MNKTNESMNSTKKNLKPITSNDLNDISTNLKSTRSIINDIKESNLVKKISNINILDAKDFIPIY